MSSLKLDNTGDIDVTNNEVTLTEGLDAIRQHLQCRYRTFLGEWFLDTSIGVPYYQEILTKQPTFQLVQSVLKAVALETPGVTDLTEFTFDYDPVKRWFTLALACLTTEGQIDFSQFVEV